LELKAGVKDQILTLIPFSDFQVRSFTMPIVHDQPAGEDNLVLTIVIVGLAVVVTIGFSVYICILVKKSKKEVEERVSILTEDKSLRSSLMSAPTKYQPPSTSQLNTKK
jgi:hypothetical protein